MKRILTLCLSLAFIPSLFAQDGAKPKPVTVPFIQVESGHFMVKVKLNGKGPYNLIFDTGAPTTLIDNRIAKDSGVQKGGGGFLFGASGTPKTIDTLELGPLKADKVSTMVMDHPTVAAFSDYYKKKKGETIDGILGFPFFAKFATTVNYQTRELTFTPNGYQPEDVMQSLMKNMMSKAKGKPEPKVMAPLGYWGLRFEAKSTGDDAAGVTVDLVEADSPAAKAGIKKGDRLLTLDGRWTDTVPDAYAAAGFVKPGTEVEVAVKRDSKEATLKVTPVGGF